ncbi:MAG: ABC transporter permease [Chloroflexi bacterium]|nr:ABC transporter permease [Chloroflexota bacterium]
MAEIAAPRGADWVEPPAGSPAVPSRRWWLRRPPIIPTLPMIMIGIIFFAAIFASVIAPFSPTKNHLFDSFTAPWGWEGGSSTYILGTDFLGRDIFSRIIHGARISLTIAGLVILIGASVGTLVGIVAGYFGGLLDSILMRIADLVLGIPLILVAIVLVTVTGASVGNIIFIVSAFVWPRYARIIRSETLSLREQDFVMLARVAGISSRRIMLRHILPNVVSTLIVLCTLQVGQVVLLESALSFLGVGIPPPKPSWGIMVADGRTNLTSGWWISLTPGLAIVVLVVSFNLVGDWLRDRLDPRLQRY